MPRQHDNPRHDDRETNVLCVRVYLLEAARRRHHPANRDFYWTLLQWAANARRRASAQPRPCQQMPLFTCRKSTPKET